MPYLVISILFLFPLALFASEEYFARRIQAHLILNDFQNASNEAREALLAYPNSEILTEEYIRVLAKQGEEREMIGVWDGYYRLNPERAMKRELLEGIAWGVLSKASKSSSLVMRQMSLIAACYSQDAKGISILHQGMRDSNHMIRAAAISLAGNFRDRKLIEEIKILLKNEKTWIVRQQVIQTIGKMKIVALKNDLVQLLISEKNSQSEKKLAITALVQLLNTLNRVDAERLANSPYSGLRQLVCRAIAYFDSNRDVDLLLTLIRDPLPDVRKEAYQALGLLKPQENSQRIIQLATIGLNDLNPYVGISAAWLLTLYCPDQSPMAFSPFFHHHSLEVRYFAAGALNATGKYGISVALEEFSLNQDPYVRLNLALGLIGQRENVKDAVAFIRHMLTESKEKWTKIENGLFSVVAKRNGNHLIDSLMTPESENQIIRLELLNLLAILKDPYAQCAIREYLSERPWGITASAATSLLIEGDETAIDIVNNLLDDPQPMIRLQAALILSMWSREERAIQILKDAYVSSDPETKGKILESLGRIGSFKSMPFLMEVLKEPSQTLRLISAMAIIQCSNH